MHVGVIVSSFMMYLLQYMQTHIHTHTQYIH